MNCAYGRVILEPQSCAVDGCYSPVAKGCSICWAHVKRRQRGLEVNVLPRDYGLSPWKRLQEVVFSFSDLTATDNEGFRLAKEKLRKAAHAYVRSCATRRVRKMSS